MDKQLVHYYTQQVGTGITGFQGVKYQRGHGFFGRLLSKAVFPVLRFLGKHALSTGANIASDVILDKKNWKDSAKERLEETGIDIAKTGIDRAKKYVHEGKGRKRKRNCVLSGKDLKRRRKYVLSGKGRKRRRKCVLSGKGTKRRRKTVKRKKAIKRRRKQLLPIDQLLK